MRIAAFNLCLILILTAPVVVAQQTPTQNQSWDALRQLQAGEKLRVERKTGKKFSGNLIRLTDTELAIERKGKTLSFGRDEVKNVWLVAPPSGRKRAIFAAVGGGVSYSPEVSLPLGSRLKNASPIAGMKRPDRLPPWLDFRLVAHWPDAQWRGAANAR